MNQYKFRTNIKCSGCIARVSPYLNAHSQIKSWKVDTESPEKMLTVEAEGLSSEWVAQIVKQAGYMAEPAEGKS